MRGDGNVAVFEMAVVGHIFRAISAHFWLIVAAVLILIVCRVAASAAAASRERERLRRLSQSPFPVIDLMNGLEFEEYVATRFRDAGFPVNTTPMSGDFGVDLIVSGNGHRVAVQCKRLSRPVGVAAVQQVVAGARHYGCNTAMVISNQEFTPAARELAHTHECSLVGRGALAAWDAVSAVRDELTYATGQPLRDPGPIPGQPAISANYILFQAEAQAMETLKRAKAANPSGGVDDIIVQAEALAMTALKRAKSHLDQFSPESAINQGDKANMLIEMPSELDQAAAALEEIAKMMRLVIDEAGVAYEPPKRLLRIQDLADLENASESMRIIDFIVQAGANANVAARRAKAHVDQFIAGKTELADMPKELDQAAETLYEIAFVLRLILNQAGVPYEQ